MKYLLLILLFWSCGTNTDTPTFPFIFLNPIGTPQIAGILPTDVEYTIPTTAESTISSTETVYKPEFIIKYYVTNTEQQFVGYNLYITSTIPSLAETQVGASVYLEDGVEPSFRHFATEASTESSGLIRRRIKNRVPAPGIFPFQKCEVYTFTLRALYNNGALSNPSAPVSACSSKFPAKCPEATSCNPASCNTASCSSPSSCVVGTLCNPCDSSKAVDPNDGCECLSGQSPPGCNP